MLAGRLAARTGLPLIHLDRLYWRPRWAEMPKEEWEAMVRELVRGDSWVMDGNYGGTLDMRLTAADTVILLDLPRLICLRRIIRRRFQFHGRNRPDVADGCPERLSWTFLRWIWSYPTAKRPKLLKKLGSLGRDKNVIILRSAVEVEQFVASVSRPPAEH